MAYSTRGLAWLNPTGLSYYCFAAFYTVVTTDNLQFQFPGPSRAATLIVCESPAPPKFSSELPILRGGPVSRRSLQLAFSELVVFPTRSTSTIQRKPLVATFVRELVYSSNQLCVAVWPAGAFSPPRRAHTLFFRFPLWHVRALPPLIPSQFYAYQSLSSITRGLASAFLLLSFPASSSYSFVFYGGLRFPLELELEVAHQLIKIASLPAVLNIA